MANLAGEIGELKFTIQITKPTGEVREIEMVGAVNPEQLKQLQADGLLTDTPKE